MKRNSENLEEHPAVSMRDAPDGSKKKKKKKSWDCDDGLPWRESASQTGAAGSDGLIPPQSIKEEDHEVSLLQSKKKKKKKRCLDKEEAVDLIEHQRKKEKKGKMEELPAAADLSSPKKKKKEKMEEERFSLPPSDGSAHQKKRRRMEEMTSQEEDGDQVCEVMFSTDPNREEAAEEANVSSTRMKKKKKRATKEKQEKKKEQQGGYKKKGEEEEEEINWDLVKELQEYLPHIKYKCLNQVKKMLTYDLQRFRAFKQQGISARMGRFSEQENQLIRQNVADFQVLTGIGSAEKLLFPQRFKEEANYIKRLKKQHRFMEKIASGIPRPCHQVYIRALKLFDEKNNMGMFSEEEVNNLIRFHNLHGNNWKLIAELMDRSIQSLQKRFDTIGGSHGAWGADEEKRLKRAVQQYLETQSNTDGSGVTRDQLYKQLPWREISKKVQTRSWVQCRHKWLFILEHRMNIYRNAFNRGADSYSAKIRLINTLYHSAVEDAADINWEEIAETVGTMSPWGIQRIFTRLKVRKVPHFHSLSFGEIMDFLYHHLVPVLQEKLSSCRKKERLQEQQQQDRYQLSDIFNSDVEDEDNS